jgi:hypothetical protein
VSVTLGCAAASVADERRQFDRRGGLGVRWKTGYQSQNECGTNRPNITDSIGHQVCDMTMKETSKYCRGMEVVLIVEACWMLQ